MPLNNALSNSNAPLPPTSLVDILRDREIHGANESRSRRDSGASNDSRVSNPLGAKDVVPSNERHNKILDLKMEVPDTMEARPTTSGKHFSGWDGRHTGQVETRRRQAQMQIHQPQESIFDHTESFDDDSSFQDDENYTMVYRGDRLQPEKFQAPLSQSQQLYGNNANIASFDIPLDFVQEKAQMEREYQQRERQFNHKTHRQSRFDIQANNKFSQAVEEQQAIFDTPSRAKAIPTRPPQSTQITKNVSFDSPNTKGKDEEKDGSPELEIPRSQAVVRPESAPPIHKQIDIKAGLWNRSQPSREHQSVRQPFSRSLVDRNQERSSDPPRITPADSFRASDCPTSSEDENLSTKSKPPTPTPDNETTLKRRREQDLDYEVDVLRNMKYDDLHSQRFDTDPRHTDQDIAFDSQGNVMTLLQRLSNLSKMSEEEQKIMFRKQDDTEWAQMGSWFIERFQEDLKKLMDVRFERRKISMRFENEIRRRQRDIEWHSSGVEQELKELKQGGGELIKGRDVSSRRGTPQKR